MNIKEADKISPYQLLLLLITMIISTADIFLPKFVAEEAMRDSWLSVIIGTIFSIIVANIFISLGKRFPNKTLGEFSCDILGKPLGKLVGIFYIYFYLFISWAVLRELLELYVMSFNNEAPKLFYGIVAVMICMYAVSKGVKSISVVNAILLPMGMVTLIIIAIFNIPLTNINNFLPFLYEGLPPIFKGALLIQAWLLETVVILVYLPFLKDKKKIRGVTILSIILLGLTLLVGILTISVFGEITEKMVFPALYYVRVASFGDFLERLDILFAGVWISGILIKVMIFYHIALVEISNVFSLKSYKAMIIPVGILIAIMSLTTNRLSDILSFLHFIWPFFSLTASFLIPSVLLIVSVIRKKRENA